MHTYFTYTRLYKIEVSFLFLYFKKNSLKSFEGEDRREKRWWVGPRKHTRARKNEMVDKMRCIFSFCLNLVDLIYMSLKITFYLTDHPHPVTQQYVYSPIHVKISEYKFTHWLLKEHMHKNVHTCSTHKQNNLLILIKIEALVKNKYH